MSANVHCNNQNAQQPYNKRANSCHINLCDSRSMYRVDPCTLSSSSHPFPIFPPIFQFINHHVANPFISPFITHCICDAPLHGDLSPAALTTIAVLHHCPQYTAANVHCYSIWFLFAFNLQQLHHQHLKSLSPWQHDARPHLRATSAKNTSSCSWASSCLVQTIGSKKSKERETVFDGNTVLRIQGVV